MAQQIKKSCPYHMPFHILIETLEGESRWTSLSCRFMPGGSKVEVVRLWYRPVLGGSGGRTPPGKFWRNELFYLFALDWPHYRINIAIDNCYMYALDMLEDLHPGIYDEWTIRRISPVHSKWTATILYNIYNLQWGDTHLIANYNIRKQCNLKGNEFNKMKFFIL